MYHAEDAPYTLSCTQYYPYILYLLLSFLRQTRKRSHAGLGCQLYPCKYTPFLSVAHIQSLYSLREVSIPKQLQRFLNATFSFSYK